MAKKQKPIRASKSKTTRKSVDIKTAENGYVVHTYDDSDYDGKSFIAKNKKEAKDIANKYLNL